MAKIIKQIVIDLQHPITDNDFTNGWSQPLNGSDIIYSLTIYALPGTLFRFNESNSSFIMNNSGVFQINLEKPISSLQIDEDSYNLIANNNHTCIIDYYTEEVMDDE